MHKPGLNPEISTCGEVCLDERPDGVSLICKVENILEEADIVVIVIPTGGDVRC